MAGNHFPVGMRVLAVDGDQIGLKVLENLLRKCQYHVTTTTQAIEALEMLRKNKNEFELVISDVNMADMDGFKFLEQVVIEMDLPIIMLSGYSDKQSVMKSITCGACYCLIKPVRVEVLGNIWQHVVRKRIDGKNRDMTANKEKIYNMAGKDVQSIITSYNNPDHNKLVGKKRKKQVEQKEPYNKENGEKNGEASTRKKSRLVWTAELHRKFVYAVNQLGLDKAYPRRLLELMNIKGLTKEHVASHLQKYRLSLKKPIQHSWINENGDFGTLFESRSILENKLSSFGSYGTCKLNFPSPHGMNLSTSNSFISSQNIPTSTKTQNSAVFHSPVEASSVHVESLDTDICADLLEHWPNEAWSGNQTQLSTFSVHSSPSSEVFNSDPHTHNYLNFSPTFPSEKSAVDFSPQSDVADFLEDVRVQIENQENLLENTFHQQWCWSSFGGC